MNRKKRKARKRKAVRAEWMRQRQQDIDARRSHRRVPAETQAPDTDNRLQTSDNAEIGVRHR